MYICVCLYLNSNKQKYFFFRNSTSIDVAEDAVDNSEEVVLEQPKIDNIFSSSRTNSKRAETNTIKICSFIVKDMMPISIVEGQGFKEMISHFAPNYKLPCRATFMSRVDLLYNEKKADVLKKLEACKSLSLTTDCWTSRATESYITVTAHGISGRFEVMNVTLATKEMKESHTAEHLRAVIEDVVDEWNLNGKIIATCHDNAKNITNAATQSHKLGYSIPCFAHSLQLAINKGLELEKVSLLLKKSSNIVSFFNHSCKASSALRTVQQNLNVKDHKLIQHVKTRWNSCYHMLQRIVEQKVCIAAVFNDRSIVSQSKALHLEIISSDFILIEEIVTILEPFEVATTYMSTAQFPTLSVVAPLIISLIDNFLKPNQNDSIDAANLKKEIKIQLFSRFAFIFSEKKEIHIIASYLDPRYKNLKGCNIRGIEKVIEWLKNEYSMKFVPAAITPKTKSVTNFLFPEENIEVAFNEIESYGKEETIQKDSCPLEWWKQNSFRYPVLSKIAIRYLCIPATSTASERVFSAAGNIVSAKRSCLKPENVNKLVFLTQNKHL